MQLTTTADRTFVYGYSSIAQSITTSDAFLIFPVEPNGAGTGRVGIGTKSPAHKLHVVGNGYATGSFTSASDVRYKKNITSLGNTLSKLAQLRGVRYDHIEDPDSTTPGQQIGVIAQELEAEYPELVQTDENGYKSVAYGKMSAVLLQALKELKAEQDQLQKEKEALEQRVDGMEAFLQNLGYNPAYSGDGTY